MIRWLCLNVTYLLTYLKIRHQSFTLKNTWQPNSGRETFLNANRNYALGVRPRVPEAKLTVTVVAGTGSLLWDGWDSRQCSLTWCAGRAPAASQATKVDAALRVLSLFDWCKFRGRHFLGIWIVCGGCPALAARVLVVVEVVVEGLRCFLNLKN